MNGDQSDSVDSQEKQVIKSVFVKLQEELTEKDLSEHFDDILSPDLQNQLKSCNNLKQEDEKQQNTPKKVAERKISQDLNIPPKNYKWLLPQENMNLPESQEPDEDCIYKLFLILSRQCLIDLTLLLVLMFIY